MTWVVGCVAAPLLLLALFLGAGLLIDRASGGNLPGALLPAAGYATLVCAGQLMTGIAALAPVTPWVIVALAFAGFALGARRVRAARLDWLLVAGALVVFVICLAPVLLAGEMTLAGYLLDTTAGIHMAGAQQLVEHGRDFSSVPPSSLRGAFDTYFGSNYPTGIHVILGSLGRVTHEDTLWLYQPLLAVVLAVSMPALYLILRCGGVARRFAIGGAIVASVPALTYAYQQMGAIKEIGLIPITVLLAGTFLCRRQLLRAGPRGMLGFAVAAAGGIGVIGLAFMPWVLVTGALIIGFAIRDVAEGKLPRLPVVRTLAVPVAAGMLLALPTVVSLAGSFRLASNISQSNAAYAADPGNLLRPLEPKQMFGVWLGGSHRVAPLYPVLTDMLIALVLLAAAIGVWTLVRRRRWPVLGVCAGAALIWFGLTLRGTDWTDAKLLVITSPVAMVVAVVGVHRVVESRVRVLGLLAAAVIVAAVLASDVLTYRETNLLPAPRYRELATIADRFAGEGPVLMPDFDEMSFPVLGRRLAPDGPGFARYSAKVALERGHPGYGHWFSLNEFALRSLDAYASIIVRVGPDQRRPPSDFRLVYAGRFYQLWRRGTSSRPRERLTPLQRTGTSISCRRIQAFAARAGSSPLVAATLPDEVNLPLARSRRTRYWRRIGPTQSMLLTGAGKLRIPFSVPTAGAWRTWLKGQFTRGVEVLVDGRKIGVISRETGGEGNVAHALPAALTRGRHELEIRRPGGSLAPGDRAPSFLSGITVQRVPKGPEVRSVSPSQWRTLCDRRLAWIERASA